MKKSDIYISIGLMLLSIYVYIHSNSFPTTNIQYGPAFVPQVTVVCLFVFSLILFFQSIPLKRKNDISKLEKINWKLFFGNIAIWVFIVTIIQYIGFITSFFILLLFYQLYFGKNYSTLSKALIISGISTLCIYIIMIVILKIPLIEPWL